MGTPIRVLVVDDSAFICHTLSNLLNGDKDIKVVGKATNGLEAMAKLHMLKPDVIILDVEMPGMDGLSVLKRIMIEHPTPVIMFSVLTKPGAGPTVRALMRGAFDFVGKPDNQIQVHTVIDQLKEKIKAAVGYKVEEIPVIKEEESPPPLKLGAQRFRKNDPLIVIGASTGGPHALHQVLSELPANLPAAVVVVQHMPPDFTRSLAQRLNEICSLRVQEAASGDRLALGLVLLAPGDFHLYIDEHGPIKLDHGPRRNGVRPSVDVTMRSAAKAYGAKVIGVILTGMGNDGTEGARWIKAAGGTIIAEAESTCVVYGMPRGVIEAGMADHILPLPKIGEALVELTKNGTVGV